jgi:FkbM family methyltransferase
MQNGTFEPVETALLQRCIERADVFIDVGANVGFYTCMARKAGKHTLAIEPLADNLRYLYRNLQANGWNDVEVWPLAVSSQPGLLQLYGAQTGASLVPGWAGVSASFSRITAVSTLDLIVGARFDGKRTVVKVDVEGAEQGVLEGAARLLAGTPRPVWLIEILRDIHRPGGNPDFARTFELMRSHGYSVYKADAMLTPVTDADVCRLMDGRQEDTVNSWVFSVDQATT